MRERRFALFFISFYILWIIKELVFSHFQVGTLTLIIVKMIVWVFPVYYYLTYFDQIQNPFSYLKVNQNIFKGIKWGTIISLILVAFEETLTYALHGQLNFNLGTRWLTTFIFAFPEEVVFRAFILQKISKSIKFTKANLYTSFLFVSIHFPHWFISGITVPKLIFSVVSVLVVSYGLGYIFKRTHSIWSSTIVHTVYNLLLYARV